jgi:hypothetical protein
LRQQLGELLALRQDGLITQAEYEARLDDIEFSLGSSKRLLEKLLHAGGTRYVILNTRTHRRVIAIDLFRAYQMQR